jgi:hypothetical protein
MNPRYNRLVFLLLLFGVSSIAPSRLWPAQNHAVADSLLHRVVQLYDEGSYITAEIEGRRLLEQEGLSDSIHVQAEKYIAFSLIAQDKSQSAAPHFRTILQLDSTFNLDPQLISPKIISVFQQTREKYFNERLQLPERELRPVVSRQISFRAIAFPGWEQLYQGRQGIGYTFLSLGVASLVSTIYCDFQRRSLRDSYLQASTTELAVDRYKKYNGYYKAELYSAALFVLTYLVSEVEVFTRGIDEAPTPITLFHGSNYVIASLKIHF